MRVLIVEDDPMTSRSLEMSLRAEGMVVDASDIAHRVVAVFKVLQGWLLRHPGDLPVQTAIGRVIPPAGAHLIGGALFDDLPCGVVLCVEQHRLRGLPRKLQLAVV